MTNSSADNSVNTNKYAKRVLFAVLAGMFATSFPVTVLSISLGVLAKEFQTSEVTIALVVSIPMLLSAIFLPLLGKMGDMYGHRKIFLIGFAGATVASLLTAIAWNAPSLISFRSLAAAVGSATQPAAMALLCSVYPPQERVKALGLWTMTTALSPALGLAIGGTMIDLIGWRLIFTLQAGLSVFVWFYAFNILRETEKFKEKLDVKGSLAFAISIGAIMFALIKAKDFGLTSLPIVTSLLLGIGMFLVFIHIEKKIEYAVLPLKFFRDRNFSLALVTTAFLLAGYMGALIMTPLYLIEELQFPISAVAGIMLLRTLTLTISSPIGGQLGSKLGSKTTATTGSIFLVAGLCILSFGVYQDRLPFIILGLILQGAGFGFSLPALSATVTNAVPNSHLGVASSANRLASALGGAFGISIASVVYAMTTSQLAFTFAFVSLTFFSILALISSRFIEKH